MVALSEPKHSLDLCSRTPARIARGRAGARPRTSELLLFRADHAAARDATRELVDTYEAQMARSLSGIDQTLRVLQYAVETNGPAGALGAMSAKGLLPPGLVFQVAIVGDGSAPTGAARSACATAARRAAARGAGLELGHLAAELSELVQDDRVLLRAHDCPALCWRRSRAASVREGSGAGAPSSEAPSATSPSTSITSL